MPRFCGHGYPRSRKRTFNPAALVYSKSTVLHDAFDAGPTVTAKRSRFLVIPTEAGRRLHLAVAGPGSNQSDERGSRRSARMQACCLNPAAGEAHGLLSWVRQGFRQRGVFAAIQTAVDADLLAAGVGAPAETLPARQQWPGFTPPRWPGFAPPLTASGPGSPDRQSCSFDPV